MTRRRAPNAGAPERPTELTEELLQEIFTRISGGESVGGICREPHMPSKGIFFNRMINDEEIADRYARATSARADARFERIDEMKADVLNGLLDPNAARVVIDAERWQAGKERPKKYGEKQTVDITNSDGSLDREKLEAKYTALLAKVSAKLEKNNDPTDLA